jgi:hypothetical protein
MDLVNTFEKFFKSKDTKPIPAPEIIRRREINLPSGNSFNLLMLSGLILKSKYLSLRC